MTSTRQPDVEVYLRSPSSNILIQWLNSRFKSVQSHDIKGLPKNAQAYIIKHNEFDLPVIIIESAAKGFCSILFETQDSPWANDAALAAELHDSIGYVVRYSDGGWSEGADPDAWIQIDNSGTKSIIWKG